MLITKITTVILGGARLQLVASDHASRSGLVEYKKEVMAVQSIHGSNTEVTIYNFALLNRLKCVYQLSRTICGEGREGLFFLQQLQESKQRYRYQRFLVPVTQAKGFLH